MWFQITHDKGDSLITDKVQTVLSELLLQTDVKTSIQRISTHDEWLRFDWHNWPYCFRLKRTIITFHISEVDAVHFAMKW